MGVHADRIRVPPGLEGVILCETEVSDVDGQAGSYRYRDYDAVELARKRSLEDVWHLLLYGTLPDAAERSDLIDAINAMRGLPPGLTELLAPMSGLSSSRDFMASLRSACSLLSEVCELQPIIDLDIGAVRQQALKVCATLPTMVAALYRLASDQPVIPPDEQLGIAANYLYMLGGIEPDPVHARVLEQYMILAADHGMGAGTLAARVVVSTGADFGSAAVAAIAALSGPLHGGAPDRALRMLDEIGSREHIDEWLKGSLGQGGRVMGFGHRVYRAPDPRALLLRELAQQMGGDRANLAGHVEARAAELLEQAKPGRQLRVNVEFYAAVVMEQLGIPANLFSSTFALARMPGWSAHILEQAGNNRLIRPLTDFTGKPLVPVPEDG